MATSLPDPRDFKSWEDAFQHPLPAVRKLEQQLRSNAAENRERLRSLVGGSYRDLLGTAERICEMDETMQGIETTLGLTAAKCNSGVVEKIFGNSAKLNVERGSRSAQQNGMAAQLSFLRNCHSTMVQLLKHEDQLYVAAKVLVLGRLVHKTLSQQVDAPPLVNGLRNLLASTRSKLLKSIDRSFADPHIESTLLVSNMCAFSLAKSSAPTDVLRHFLNVRLDAIRSLASGTGTARLSMIKAVQLFKSSLSATHTIFPKRLADALGKVKLQPLLQDKDVKSLAELNLDIYGRWIADDVRSFTPWPRHDELQKSEAEKLIKSWVPAAMSSLESTLDRILTEQEDFEAVLSLREAVLKAHLSSNERAPGAISSELLDLIREALNKRLMELVKLEAGGILALAEQIRTSIVSSKFASRATDATLWDMAEEGAALNSGSANFKDAIRSRVHGYNDTVKACMDSSGAWETAITKARLSINSMKERRWEDDILDAGADDDDFDLDSKQALLSEDDPRALEEALNEALRSSLTALGGSISTLVKDGDSSDRAIFLLRILRDLTQKIRVLDITFDHTTLSQPLFDLVASSMAETAHTGYATALERFIKASRLSEVALWEGHPALPSQPMTSTFKLLRNITRTMAGAGQDLWTPAMVDSLKIALAATLASSFEDAITALNSAASEPENHEPTNGVTNGYPAEVESAPAQGSEEKASDVETVEQPEKDAEANGSTDEDSNAPIKNGETNGVEVEKSEQPDDAKLKAGELRKIKAQQLLFDIYYLQRALKPELCQDATITFESATSNTLELTELSAEHHGRVKKSVNDYWRKTYLLFGLLV